MMRIGVTGAFGFLGANFVAALLEAAGRAGESGGRESAPRIVAFASHTRANPLFNSSRVRVEELDLLDPRGLAGKFAGLDAVAHFAGRVDYRRSAMKSVWDTDVLGAKRLFDAALADGLRRVLYVSSICALGPGLPGAERADERSSPYGDPRWPISFRSPEETLEAVEASLAGDYRFMRRMRVAYLDSKLAGWELAKLYARDRGLDVVTIFPGTAVGPGDLRHAISKLVDDVWEGRLRLSFGGSSSFVSSRDLARGALLALERGRAGEGYVIGGSDEEDLRYPEFQDLVAELARAEGWWAQRRPPVPPYRLVFALSAVAELFAPGGSLSRAFAASGSLQNCCSSAKARAELGYEPSRSLAPAILECRRFMEAGRVTHRRPWLLSLARRLSTTPP